MRWLTGWSGSPRAADPVLAALRPIAATPLWAGPNPLWAVGDWRPDEIRLAVLRPGGPPTTTRGLDAVQSTEHDTPATLRLAVLGRCGASDSELAAGLAAARGGAVRHLTGWPGSYTVVLRIGTRSTLLLTDLAGVQPVFHTPWRGGTAYATAALPLADLVGAPIDPDHLAARLAAPESPEALGVSTPYQGVRRVLPGHVLGIRNGRPLADPYEPEDSPGVREEAPAVRELTRALLESVRCRIRARAEAPPDRARFGVDLSHGTASATVALLAAAVPLGPTPAAPPSRPERAAVAPRSGVVKGSWARNGAGAERAAEPETLTAVTIGNPEGLTLAVDAPRLLHLVLPAQLPYADLVSDPLAGPLTDEPGPALIAAERISTGYRAGGADHFTGYGARQVLDGHPARLADLIRVGRSRELFAPVAALAGADRATAGALTGTVRTPVTVLRAAHRLARAHYADALDDLAFQLTVRHAAHRRATAGATSVADLAWAVPGPAARWLSDEALAGVSQRLRIAARSLPPAEHPGARRARLALHRHAAAYRTLVHATEQRGQRLHAPFLDNQVVRAARLLPDDVRLQPGARHALLRAVLTGAGRTDLPADWGRGPRPDQAYAARTGLRLAADSIDELFHRPLLADAGLIDPPAVRHAFTLATDPDASLPPGTLSGLAELIATELWLRRIAARHPGSSWTGLPPAQRAALTF